MEYGGTDKKMGLINFRIKNKKAMFFTVLVIVLLVMFLLVYTSYSVVTDRGAIDKRIETMNNFIFSLKEDMSRQIYISGYRAILSLQGKITDNGIFIASSRDSIREALLNGTINNQSINLMEGYTLGDWNSRVSELADEVNLDVNYSLRDVSITQEDPWHVKIIASINLSVRDKGNMASWSLIENVSAEIEISGFEDPIYLINTNGKVVNKITRAFFFPFVSGADVSNLTLHVQNSSYIASPTAPSYLDRLEGKNTASPYGIESLVYLPKLSNQGISIQSKSVVDYIYFSQNNPVSHNIQGMPSWFRIDDAHLSAYQVSGLTIN